MVERGSHLGRTQFHLYFDWIIDLAIGKAGPVPFAGFSWCRVTAFRSPRRSARPSLESPQGMLNTDRPRTPA